MAQLVSDHNGSTTLKNGNNVSFKAGKPFEGTLADFKHVKGITKYVAPKPAEETKEETAEE
jgi:hypothetical protein